MMVSLFERILGQKKGCNHRHQLWDLIIIAARGGSALDNNINGSFAREARDICYLCGWRAQIPIPGEFYRSIMFKPFMKIATPV